MITPPAAINTGNWAGYEWHGGTVAASVFTVPSMPNPTPAEKSGHAILALWAGLGVYPTIAQIGTYDYYQAGKINWAGFCAFWPESDVSCGKGISTGDKLAVSVHRNGFTYTMRMRDYGPHNVWAVSIKGTLPQENTTAEFIAEDTSYGTLEPLGKFSNVPVNTSGDPATEVYSADAGYAVKTGSRSFTIHR